MALLTDNLVSYYKLNETSGAVIDSAGANNGTNNGATANSTGKIGTAYLFEGSDDNINFGDVLDFNFQSEAMSASFWVNMTSTSSTNTFIAKQQSGSPFNGWALSYDSSGRLELDANGQTGAITVRKTITLATGTFFHLAFTYDGSGNASGVNIYVDGVKQTSLTVADDTLTSSTNTSEDFLIGSRGSGLINDVNGTIDEVGIWSRELTQAEITKLFNSNNGLSYPFISGNIITKVEIDNTEFEDYQSMKVERSINDYNSSSNFTIRYDSPFGRHATDFSVGQEIIISADNLINGPFTKLLTGVVERVKFRGKGTLQTVELKGRDFSLRLQDSTVEPVVFTDTEIGSIVSTIISDNVDDITTTNVDTTSTTLKRIAFNHTTVFEALKQLAELAGFFFFVDNDKDLHFEQRNNVDSGIILDNTNIDKAILNTTREGMANSVFVYGDRTLAGFQEDFTADGTGSVFDLLSKPRNTIVTISGGTPVPQIGGVFELTVGLVSGTNAAEYLVSFNDKKIIFISGTEIGYSKIPTNGQIVQIKYDRDIPIVKFGQDRESIAMFGKKEKIINDKTINDPNTATVILKRELEKSSPFRGVESRIDGWFDLTPGQTARVTLSDFNIDEDVGMLNITYKFDKNTIRSERVITVRLDKKVVDITDEITNLRNRLNAIESADRQESDTITRLEQSIDSVFVVGSIFEIFRGVQTGSSLYLSDSIITYDGLGEVLASGTNEGLLTGSGTAIGSPYELTLLESGGFYLD